MSNKNIIKQYSSVAEFISYLDKAKVNDYWQDCQESHRPDSGEFTTPDYKAATRLAIQGDKANAGHLQKANANIKPLAPMPRTANRRSVMGFKVSAGAFAAGHPKSMIQRVQTTNARPVITIIYNTSALGDVSGQEIINTNAKVLEAIMAIEAKGTKVNLYASTLARSSGQVVGPVVKIKDSGQPFNLLRTAYSLVNPSFQRRHGWRFRETLPGIENGFKWGYGSSLQSYSAMDRALKGVVKYDVAFTFYDVECMSTQWIIDWIGKRLSETTKR